MTELLHLEFRPRSVAWVGTLVSRTGTSSLPEVRDRFQNWAQLGLGELALAIATRLEIKHRVESKLETDLARLKLHVSESADLGWFLDSGYCFAPDDMDLLFDICAGVDSCFFEWRSLYEILGKFATLYAKEILGLAVSESQLAEVVQKAGVPTAWIDPLRENRKLFFHQTAPWIALQIETRQPLKCRLVVMKENRATLDDSGAFVVEEELGEAAQGLTNAVIAVREWLMRRLEDVEVSQNRARS